MKITPSTLLSIILATIFLTSFFFVNTTATISDYETTDFPDCPEDEYCAWCDLNDDGAINIYDVVYLCKYYGFEGTPINKTALLYNVNYTFTELLSRIDLLNETLTSRINELEVQIEELNDILATKLGEPDYDSLWSNIAPGTTCIYGHNLGTSEVIVYIVGYDIETGQHQTSYGGWAGGLGAYNYGAWWHDLDNYHIRVTRNLDDTQWDYVRVRIWKI